MHLVIVAGGLGSRLAPLTNYIPKFLVNIGKNTGYVEQIRYWQNGIQPFSITVIVHSAYAELVSEYHKMYFPNVDLIVKTVDVANGSAHAILSTCDHLDGQSVLFSWCDVLPAEPIPFESLLFYENRKNIVFTNYDGACRYKLADGLVQLDPENRGGIFGLYYVGEYSTKTSRMMPKTDGQDFVEIMHWFGPLEEYEVGSIIDFGDLPKLQRVRSKADEAREFNSVEFIGDFVLKTAMNEQGKKIIEREVQWYEELGELLGPNAMRPAVPNAWISTDKTSFFMSKVKGVSIWKAWPDLSPEDRRYVLQQVIAGEQMLYDLGKAPVNRLTVIRDVTVEADKKLQDRYREIRGVINAFGPVREVNGFELSTRDPMVTISRLSDEIEQHYLSLRDSDITYGFIHGDLQFSNSMVDLDTLKVTIIDPRGYFGKTLLRGLQDYDIGKLLYALSGYDTFNQSKTFGISSLGDGRIEFEIPEPSHDGITDIIATHFKPIHHLWLAVCWIGLAQYIKNDPVKSVAAHYHGLVLAEKALRKI